MTLKQKIHAAAALLLSCMLLTGCAASQGSLFEKEPLRVTADMDKLEVMETAPKFKIKTSFGASSEDDIVPFFMKDIASEVMSKSYHNFYSNADKEYPCLVFSGKRSEDTMAWQTSLQESCESLFYSRTPADRYYNMAIWAGLQPIEGGLSRALGEVADADPLVANYRNLADQILQAAGHTQYRCDIAARFTPEDIKQLYLLTYSTNYDWYMTEAAPPDCDLYFFRMPIQIDGLPEDSLEGSASTYREAYFLFDKDGIRFAHVPAVASLNILETYEPCTVQEAYEAAIEGLPLQYTEMYHVRYAATTLSYNAEEHELYYRFEFRRQMKLDEEYDDFVAQSGVKGRYGQLMVYVRARDGVKMTGDGWENTTSIGGHFIHRYNAPELYTQEGGE